MYWLRAELDPESGNRRILLEGLDTPTGVLWLDGHLWVMQRRSLSVARWDGEGDPESLRVVLEDLPFNGRSEGTLTALPDGRLLYETSGSIRDGEVVEGVSSVDDSMITGESMPVIKEPGHKLFGGCINGSGVLRMRATAVGGDTLLAGIIRMVEQAQATKLPLQKVADRIAYAELVSGGNVRRGQELVPVKAAAAASYR